MGWVCEASCFAVLVSESHVLPAQSALTPCAQVTAVVLADFIGRCSARELPEAAQV